MTRRDLFRLAIGALVAPALPAPLPPIPKRSYVMPDAQNVFIPGFDGGPLIISFCRSPERFCVNAYTKEEPTA